MAELGRLLFRNRVMDRTAMKQFISSLVTHFGAVYTAHILDQIKTLGFQQATHAAASLGIDDLLATPSREWLIRDAELRGFLEEDPRHGNVHAVEKLRRLIEAWYATSEYVKTEVNLNFGATDPSNPVHVMSFSGARGNISQIHQLLGMRGLMLDPKGQIIGLPIRSNFREGLSLTEYIISCYGARKGIVDIAVRTADAGHLTRRLVEVAQCIVVRKTDCGTVRGVTVSPIRDQRNRQMVAQSRLVGRVLAGNVYVDARCIATRGQDIGAGLADQLIASQTRPIYIRSPSVCNGMFWICQLCYGWSLTRTGIVGLGEAVGIIAGQSIGEPGTQLTLRTFHTGGIFTGDIAQHIRAPFTGTIQYNATSAHLTRTRHGHPAWICDDDSPVVICNEYETRHLIIPSQSLILVRNNQHVESKQVIAEVHVATPTSRETFHKCIHPNMYGELHVGTRVRRDFEHTYSNIQLLPETSYVWVLSGRTPSPGSARLIFHGFRDKIGAQSLLAGKDPSLSELHPAVGRRKKTNPFYDRSVESPINHSRHDRASNGNLIYLSPPRGHRLVPRGVLPLHERPGLSTRDTKLPSSGLVHKSQQNKVSPQHIAESSVVPDDSARYKIEEPETTTVGHGPVKISSAGRSISGNGITGMLVARHDMIGGSRFSLLPPEVVCFARDSSPSASQIATSVGAGTRIAPSPHGWSGRFTGARGMAVIGPAVKMLPGTVTCPEEYKGICGGKYTPIPIEILPGAFESTDWKYYPLAIPHTGNPLALLLGLAAIGCDPTTGSKSSSVPAASRDWDSPSELIEIEARTPPFIGVRPGSPLLRYYPNYRNSVKDTSAESKGCEVAASLEYISDALVQRTSHYYSGERPVFGSKGIPRVSPGRSPESTSFLVLSPDDVLDIPLSAAPGKVIGRRARPKTNSGGALRGPADPPGGSRATPWRESGGRDRGASLDSIITMDAPPQLRRDGSAQKTSPETLGVLGTPHSTVHSALIPRRLTNRRSTRKALLNRYSVIGKLKKTLRVPEWYPWGEDRTDLNLGTCERTRISAYLHTQNRTRRSPLFLGATPCSVVSLGRPICGGASVCKFGLPPQPCQIKAVDTEFTAIRLAEPCPADAGATVHSCSGSIVGKGDALMTLIYERLRFEDIIFQGPPKIEQFLESRPDTSVSTDSRESFGDWKSGMAWIFGCLSGYLLSARISLERSQITLVDRIGRGYRSQGVQVADKHVEIIVRQIASKLGNLEDGMANAFLPGELTETSRARRMNRALESKSTYGPVLSGVTRASLNTKSFLSEASFRDTARVLARAAIRGQMDWLKGLKGNVIVGGTVPAGTGQKGALRQIDPLAHAGGVDALGTEDKPFHIVVEHLFLSQRDAVETEFRLPSDITIHDTSALLSGGVYSADIQI
uniref:DNA-directed RNA polymerase n=1 Tax=Selaginella lepidophylla TaxID=59777 RepID=A0A3Q9R2W5_SELLP|nr:RNA polymerase subunit beta'' [Selaginella lepidophylla]AZU95892.1 RNA polymerase subunit beta'' [Selaginella lepidophylla]